MAQGATAVLVRHGETDWSASGRHTGLTDVPLTERGRDAAARVAPRLAGRDFVLVLTSPLQRARETCALAGLGDRAEVDPDLVEWDYGAYEGLTTAEIRETRPGWSVWDEGVPEGEAVDAVGVRADRVVERLLAAGGDVAVFAHGHLLRVLGARWIELQAARGASLHLSTAAICELGWERERRVLSLWNDVSHLDG